MFELRRIFAWRNNTRTVFVAGRPIKFGILGGGDILGLLPGGRFLSIEVKAPKATTAKKRAKQQEAFRTAINDQGGLAIVARSVEDVMAALTVPHGNSGKEFFDGKGTSPANPA
jgi:hypothetical protein